MVVPPDQPTAYALYHLALKREIATIADTIPHSDLSIQIDIAPEFGFIEGIWSSEIGSSKEQMLRNITDLTDALPAAVELGYHLCYGDFGHKHFVEPTDMANLVDVANALAATGPRHIDWVHMPVPRNRSDASYFEPLNRLQIQDTTLFLGVVHLTDGLSGTQERIKAAERARRDFGIATECGWGRRTPDQVDALIELHQRIH
jgi:methionine synthase II (cobalamin-independent)